MATSAPPRTLADQLRAWSDAELTALLDRRPDLASPAPQDSSQLASRAGTRASVLRALDDLDRLELVAADAAVALGARTTMQALVAAIRAAPDRARAAVGSLRARALLWGPDDDLRAVSALTDVLGTTVSGLGPPVEQLLGTAGPERVASLLAGVGDRSTGDRAADVRRLAELLSDPARVTRLVGEIGEPARAMLEHLDATGSDGASDQATAAVTTADAVTPVEQLVARGLLMPRDRRHLRVPREVGLSLRGGTTTREAVDEPPPLVTDARSARLVDQAAAGAAHEFLHRVELLLDHWGGDPPAALRQGGLGVRELRAAATLLHSDERTTALVVEVAWSAGLIARGGTVELDDAWLPTDVFDAWRARPPAERWAGLAEAWLSSPRPAGLVGSRLQSRTVTALSPDLEQAWLAETRRASLEQVAALDPGRVLAAGTGLPSLVARALWWRPRRPPLRAEVVAWTVEEAAALGVLGLGGMPRHGRALLEDPARAAVALAPLLPPPVDHVLLQADLTAVAPGPLEDHLARELAAVADVESRGGATVYRFTEASVRHAFDLGWSAVEVHETISKVARNEVPQPLRYLVDDVARTHGTVRLGAIEAFLRSEDETALAALVHDPRAASLRLRRIAPTVVVSDTPVDILLPKLRELGVAPVVEGTDGSVRIARRDAHRARAPRGPQAGVRTARRAARTAATVTAIRAGDRAARVNPRRAPQQTPASALAVLREAAESGATVCIGYVDGDGSTHERVVDPQSVEGGWLRAYDHRSDDSRSFAVHRISSVRDVEAPGPGARFGP